MLLSWGKSEGNGRPSKSAAQPTGTTSGNCAQGQQAKAFRHTSGMVSASGSAMTCRPSSRRRGDVARSRTREGRGGDRGLAHRSGNGLNPSLRRASRQCARVSVADPEPEKNWNVADIEDEIQETEEQLAGMFVSGMPQPKASVVSRLREKVSTLKQLQVESAIRESQKSKKAVLIKLQREHKALQQAVESTSRKITSSDMPLRLEDVTEVVQSLEGENDALREILSIKQDESRARKENFLLIQAERRNRQMRMKLQAKLRREQDLLAMKLAAVQRAEEATDTTETAVEEPSRPAPEAAQPAEPATASPTSPSPSPSAEGLGEAEGLTEASVDAPQGVAEAPANDARASQAKDAAWDERKDGEDGKEREQGEQGEQGEEEGEEEGEDGEGVSVGMVETADGADGIDAGDEAASDRWPTVDASLASIVEAYEASLPTDGSERAARSRARRAQLLAHTEAKGGVPRTPSPRADAEPSGSDAGGGGTGAAACPKLAQIETKVREEARGVQSATMQAHAAAMVDASAVAAHAWEVAGDVTPGSTIELRFDLGKSFLSGSETLTLHWGFNAWSAKGFETAFERCASDHTETEAQKPAAKEEVFAASLVVPEDAVTIDFVISSNGRYDNNGGGDWHIPVARTDALDAGFWDGLLSRRLERAREEHARAMQAEQTRREERARAKEANRRDARNRMAALQVSRIFPSPSSSPPPPLFHLPSSLLLSPYDELTAALHK